MYIKIENGRLERIHLLRHEAAWMADNNNAYHSLIETDDVIIPILIDAFRADKGPTIRSELVYAQESCDRCIKTGKKNPANRD